MSDDQATSSPPPAEQRPFQAEIQQLLRILVHSLYTEREIFLRELISNASDALNRLQFELLTRQPDEVVDAGAELAIHITLDEAGRTLTIADSGIGMTREEMIDNLGTIARSGAATFLKTVQEQPGHASEIIGQFGVGFYSVFMVAEEVEVRSRSFRPDAEAVRWRSSGGDSYELSAADKQSRGTEVIVHLTEEAAEFARAWRVESTVKRHSNFVAYPIYLEERQLNERTALWRKAAREVEAEAYEAFYKQLSHDWEPPLATIHLSTDAPYDLHSILFVPSKRDGGLLRARSDHGLTLYSRKVLIHENDKELLPAYYRFIEGVVDSEDLPLNVSRETVQANQVMAQLKRSLTARVTRELLKLAEDASRYESVWREFGLFLKEGVATDFGARQELAPLLRFHSSALQGEALTSLAAYKGRMGEEQQAIFYALGDDLASVRRSPHLDAFRARGIEVLFLDEPMDAFVVQALRDFDGTPLRNVDDPSVELAPLPDEGESIEQAAPTPSFQRLVESAVDVLGSRITAVRASERLTESAARLVVPEGDGGGHEMDRVRRLMGSEEGYEVPKRILELNPRHPVVRDLAALAEREGGDPLVAAGVETLYENALLLEGLHPNPASMVERVQQLLAWATAGRSQRPGPEESDA